MDSKRLHASMNSFFYLCMASNSGRKTNDISEGGGGEGMQQMFKDSILDENKKNK